MEEEEKKEEVEVVEDTKVEETTEVEVDANQELIDSIRAEYKPQLEERDNKIKTLERAIEQYKELLKNTSHTSEVVEDKQEKIVDKGRILWGHERKIE